MRSEDVRLLYLDLSFGGRPTSQGRGGFFLRRRAAQTTLLRASRKKVAQSVKRSKLPSNVIPRIIRRGEAAGVVPGSAK